MPFFSTTSENDAPASSPTPQDLAFARRLRALVVKMASRVRPWRPSKWADEFRLLTDEFLLATENQKFVNGFPDMVSRAVRERIDAVLTWYEKNYEREGVPKLLSASAFRKHFDWVERLSKGGVATSTSDVPDKVMEVAKFVVFPRVAKLPWGKGTDRLEASVITSCAERQKVANALAPLRSDPVIGAFVRYAWQVVASDQFVITWYETMWRRLKDWKEWSGSFAGFEIRVGGKVFHEHMEGLAERYGDRALWRRACVAAGIPLKQTGG